MTITCDEELFRQLAVCLDACLPYLDRMAAKEQRAEAGKAMRQITCQQRAKVARAAVTAAGRELRMPLGDDDI